MIDAYGRGIIEGAQEAHKAKEPLADPEALARRVFAALRSAGYAHIEPEAEFIRGFIESIRLYCFICSA